MSAKAVNPCYGCTKRHQGCHATCPDGIAADAAHAAEIARRHEEKKGSGDVNAYKWEIKLKISRRLNNNKRSRKRR